MPFNLEALNLNGSYVVDARSDSLEEVMRLQGVGWATRKVAAKFANNMGLTITYDANQLLQKYTSPVKEKIVIINLNWNDSEVVDEELGVKVRYTVNFEDNDSVLVITQICPKKFERVVRWRRVNENQVQSTINYTLTDGSNQHVTVNRYYNKAPAA